MMGPVRQLVGWEEDSDTPRVLKVHFSPRDLERRCPQGTWPQPKACRRAAAAPLPAATKKAWVPWALKGGLPSAEHPVPCGPLRVCLQPCPEPSCPLSWPREKAQLQTVLPRDTVAVGIAPNDDVENSSGVSTYFADLLERCWAGVICHLSPEEEQRKLETFDGLFKAHFSHNRC